MQYIEMRQVPSEHNPRTSLSNNDLRGTNIALKLVKPTYTKLSYDEGELEVESF